MDSRNSNSNSTSSTNTNSSSCSTTSTSGLPVIGAPFGVGCHHSDLFVFVTSTSTLANMHVVLCPHRRSHPGSTKINENPLRTQNNMHIR